jgi:glycosyltransferase involved in cell wall biosynthesis
MRLCFIGGADSIHMQRWMKPFVDKGYDVHLITDQFSKVDGVTVHLLEIGRANTFLNFVSKMRQTKKLVKEIKPDVLHSHYVFGYGFFGAYSGFHPFVVSPWGSDILIDAKQSWFKRYCVRYALNAADIVTCDGNNVYRELLELDVDAKKIHRIYHGVDVKRFKPVPNMIHSKLNSHSHPVVVTTRGIKPVYDMDTFEQAGRIVRNAYPDVEFKIVKGVSHAELPSILVNSDIYVSTSLSDGGLACGVAEAMSCELPVVVTDVGDNTEWIMDGENGFVIPLKSPDVLAEKIIYLLKHPDDRVMFGRINRGIIVKNFNYSVEMDKMDDLYREFFGIRRVEN